jgi:hypothetical protein
MLLIHLVSQNLWLLIFILANVLLLCSYTGSHGSMVSWELLLVLLTRQMGLLLLQLY